MNLFNYLMAKKGHNTSVRDDLLAYLLGKRTPKEVKTATGTTISISDVTSEKIVSLTLSKESTQDGTPTPENPVEVKTVKGSIDVKIVGKNLFDKNNIERGKYYYSEGINPSGSWSISQVAIEPNQQYYLSGNNNANYIAQIVLLNSSMDVIQYLGGYRGVHLITTTENSAYIGLSIHSNDLDIIQLEKGSTTTTYESYKENIIPLPLNGNEIAGIGDYKDELIVDKNGHCWLNKKIEKKIFTDSDTFVGQYSTSSRTGFWTLIEGIKPISSGNEIPNLLSTKFTSVSMNATWKPGNMSMVTYEGNLNKVYFFLEANKTVDDIKNVLVNQPIYYPLATSQLIDLNYTVDIRLFKGINNISNSEDMDMILKYY